MQHFIIIPTRDRPFFLNRCLDSVKTCLEHEKNFPKTTILVVDDSWKKLAETKKIVSEFNVPKSTELIHFDLSAQKQFLEKIKATAPKLRSTNILFKRRGHGRTRNVASLYAIHKASNENVVVSMIDDDMIHFKPTVLKRLRKSASENGSKIFVHGLFGHPRSAYRFLADILAYDNLTQGKKCVLTSMHDVRNWRDYSGAFNGNFTTTTRVLETAPFNFAPRGEDAAFSGLVKRKNIVVVKPSTPNYLHSKNGVPSNKQLASNAVKEILSSEINNELLAIRLKGGPLSYLLWRRNAFEKDLNENNLPDWLVPLTVQKVSLLNNVITSFNKSRRGLEKIVRDSQILIKEWPELVKAVKHAAIKNNTDVN